MNYTQVTSIKTADAFIELATESRLHPFRSGALITEMIIEHAENVWAWRLRYHDNEYDMKAALGASWVLLRLRGLL